MLTVRRAADVLAALMRVDETCREVLHAIAASHGDAGDAEIDVSEMEARIALFRKMVGSVPPFLVIRC